MLPFENGGSYGRDKEDFDALRKGLAALLISELSANPGLRLIDRAESQRVLDGQGPALAERVDKATAARIGKLVGARYVVTGSFIDLYGDFRIDARLVDTDSGDIVKVVRSDPTYHDRRDMYRMVQSVADRLASGTPLPPIPASTIPRSRQVPTEAIGYFSRALLVQDRGERAKAMEYYQKALAVYPDFTEAVEGLRQAAPARRAPQSSFAPRPILRHGPAGSMR